MQIEERIDLDRALSTLTDRQRAVLLLWAVHGYTQAEIGAALGIKRAAVCRYIKRTFSKLREIT